MRRCAGELVAARTDTAAGEDLNFIGNLVQERSLNPVCGRIGVKIGVKNHAAHRDEKRDCDQSDLYCDMIVPFGNSSPLWPF